MRKTLAMILCLLMLVVSAAAAEGAITVNQEVLQIIETSYSTYGMLYAKVENTGDAPIALGDGTLAIFDADNAILATSDYVSTIPYNAILEPGDYVYLRDTTYFDDGVTAADVGTHMFSIKEYDYNGYPFVKVPCEAAMNFENEEHYGDYIDVTITNSLDYVMYDFRVAVALYDAEGNLIYVNYDYDDSIGLHPGSTMTMMVYVDSDVLDYCEANGIVPTTVDAYAYYTVD